MWNIVVCDDVEQDKEAVVAALQACEEDCRISAFASPQAALTHWEKGNPMDIAFLDILMPEISGIDLAKALRERGFAGHIVFLTSVNDFAAQSYQVKAFSYLLKPFRPAEIASLLAEIKKSGKAADTSGFHITRNGKVRFIPYTDFIYVEVRNHHLFFHLRNDEVIKIYAQLREYAPVLLMEPRISQCHRSYIINMDHVTACERTCVHMRDGSRISISRSYESFVPLCLEWMYGKA